MRSAFSLETLVENLFLLHVVFLGALVWNQSKQNNKSFISIARRLDAWLYADLKLVLNCLYGEASYADKLSNL